MTRASHTNHVTLKPDLYGAFVTQQNNQLLCGVACFALCPRRSQQPMNAIGCSGPYGVHVPSETTRRISHVPLHLCFVERNGHNMTNRL